MIVHISPSALVLVMCITNNIIIFISHTTTSHTRDMNIYHDIQTTKYTTRASIDVTCVNTYTDMW